MMLKSTALIPLLAAAMLFPANSRAADRRPAFRTGVDLVMLGLSVTDKSGNYVAGLRAEDVRVLEDGVEQTIRSFEGGGGPRPEFSTPVSVFVLFDTSNAMYDVFPKMQDAIARFVRSLHPASAVAIYSFNRNLTRNSVLGTDREAAIAALRQSVVGDDTALYDCLLLTLRDAENVPGRKVVVVFSNGPDTASALAPFDVGQVAQDAGIPVYVISGRAGDSVAESATALANRTLASETGGVAYEAISRDLQNVAFASIRTDLESSYLLTYRRDGDGSPGYRRIEVRIKGRPGYRIRTRAGYTARSEPPRHIAPTRTSD